MRFFCLVLLAASWPLLPVHSESATPRLNRLWARISEQIRWIDYSADGTRVLVLHGKTFEVRGAADFALQRSVTVRSVKPDAAGSQYADSPRRDSRLLIAPDLREMFYKDWPRLIRTDLLTGEQELWPRDEPLADGVIEAELSPNGKFLAWISDFNHSKRHGCNDPLQKKSVLVIADTMSGDIKYCQSLPFAKPALSGLRIAWSPDSHSLASYSNTPDFQFFHFDNNMWSSSRFALADKFRQPTANSSNGYIGHVVHFIDDDRIVIFSSYSSHESMISRAGADLLTHSDAHAWNSFEDLSALCTIARGCKDLQVIKRDVHFPFLGSPDAERLRPGQIWFLSSCHNSGCVASLNNIVTGVSRPLPLTRDALPSDLSEDGLTKVLLSPTSEMIVVVSPHSLYRIARDGSSISARRRIFFGPTSYDDTMILSSGRIVVKARNELFELNAQTGQPHLLGMMKMTGMHSDRQNLHWNKAENRFAVLPYPDETNPIMWLYSYPLLQPIQAIRFGVPGHSTETFSAAGARVYDVALPGSEGIRTVLTYLPERDAIIYLEKAKHNRLMAYDLTRHQASVITQLSSDLYDVSCSVSMGNGRMAIIYRYDSGKRFQYRLVIADMNTRSILQRGSLFTDEKHWKSGYNGQEFRSLVYDAADNTLQFQVEGGTMRLHIANGFSRMAEEFIQGNPGAIMVGPDGRLQIIEDATLQGYRVVNALDDRSLGTISSGVVQLFSSNCVMHAAVKPRGLICYERDQVVRIKLP